MKFSPKKDLLEIFFKQDILKGSFLVLRKTCKLVKLKETLIIKLKPLLFPQI